MFSTSFIPIGRGTLLSIRGRAEPAAGSKTAEKLHSQCIAPRGMHLALLSSQRNEPDRRRAIVMGLRYIGASGLIGTFALAAISTVSGSQAVTPPEVSIRRTADGKPDLSGVWQVLNTAAWDLQDHHAQKDVPAGRGVVEGNDIPYQPWAAEQKKDNFANRATADPESKCLLPGVPRITYMPYPFQILQTPTRVVFLYEYVHAMREVYMDLSPHPAGHIDWWMGDSRGHWEGDTLVVDVIHFNDRTWFDRAGNFHSEQLHLVERYTLLGPDHIRYEVTVDDPKVFTRPWTMSMPLYRRMERDAQVLEYECYAFDDQFHVEH
jgi:hypothetical protein